MKFLNLFIITTIIALSSATAWAQDEVADDDVVADDVVVDDVAVEPEVETPTEAPQSESTSPVIQPNASKDFGLRYRWGISASAGLEKISIVSGTMYGMDLRTGVQINDLLGLYLQSHLSFGELSSDGSAGGPAISGFTGTFTVAAIAEATLLDIFFVGAGGGYGILNNPSGPMFQARAGAYPFASRIEDSIRRRGLMVGADLRTVHIDGFTGVLVFASIGYEKF